MYPLKWKKPDQYVNRDSMFIIVLFEKVKAIFTNEAETLKNIYSKKKKYISYNTYDPNYIKFYSWVLKQIIFNLL